MIHMRTKEKAIEILMMACSFLTVLTTLGIILVLLIDSIKFFSEVSIVEFFTDTQWTPLFTEKHFGILPLLMGTLLTTFIAVLVAVPLGLTIAIYLNEYASPKFTNIVKPILEVLAAIPTVVYGFFALQFVTPLLQQFIPDLRGFNALSPGLVKTVKKLQAIINISIAFSFVRMCIIGSPSLA